MISPPPPSPSPSPRWIITVTGADRAGLVAAVSGILADEGADIEDVSMTRLSGNFATMLLARGGDLARLREKFAALAKEKNLLIHVEHAEEELREEEANCFVSAIGPNRVGIVAAISSVLASHDVNIVEMTTKLLSRTAVPVYMVRIEAVAAGNWDALKTALQIAAKDLGIEVRLEALERTDF